MHNNILVVHENPCRVACSLYLLLMHSVCIHSLIHGIFHCCELICIVSVCDDKVVCYRRNPYTAPLFWDEAQTQPLIPAYGYASDAQDPLWQLMSMQFGFTADAPDILTRWTWDNPVMATVQTGRVGSPLFPLHYNWLFGEAGINGSVISVDGVRPTDATLADGSYPFTLSYYGLYWPSHPQARQIDAILQGVQAMQTAD